VISDRSLISKDALNVSFAVQNANNVDGVFVHQEINSDSLKSNNRPRAQILQLRIAGKIAWPYKRIPAQRLDGPRYGIPKTDGDFWNVYDSEVIAKLANKVITGGLERVKKLTRAASLFFVRRKNATRSNWSDDLGYGEDF
jgi:hypothetical protein